MAKGNHKLFCAILGIALLVGVAAHADDFQKGLVASGKGNFAEAVKWYRKAADQGNATAQSHLARMYRDGKGVPQGRQGFSFYPVRRVVKNTIGSLS